MAIETKKSANHEVIREETDLFIYRFGAGAVTADDITQVTELERNTWARASYVYSVTTLDDGLSISPGALTRAAKLFQHTPPRTSAFVVRRHYLRTAMDFMLRTLRLLGAKMELRFFQDEQAALVWIAERRQARGR